MFPLAVALLALTAPLAYGQAGGTTASLSGLVVDTSGGVIPGADVVIRNNATSAESRTVTDATGRFTVPALNPGTYTVTVSLMGFKTWSAPDVQLVAATPASVKAVLDVGALEETVIVQGATEVVQTQTASVQTTIAVQQIQALPLVTRTALDYVVMLPGVTTQGADSRGSTINGLPTVTINITLDGVNVQDNNNRNGDGFFMYIRPLMDSVEEITVSTSTPGAESAGQGASQIRLVTRAGSNRFTGSAYNTWRNQAGTDDSDYATRNKKRGWLWRLNTPYYFNKRDLAKTPAGDYFIDDVRLQTPGFRLGGPAIRDRLFYFFNWEWFQLRQQANRVRYLLNPQAQQGWFAYPATDGTTRSINLFDLAASKGQTSTADPVIARLLADIRSAASTEGTIEPDDENVDKYTYNPLSEQHRHFPTLRLDYNITNAHRATFSTRYNRFASEPDFLNSQEPRFPGFPAWGGQYSDRFMAQGTVRSTFGRNVVNEARFGYSGGFGGGTQFYPEFDPSMYNCTGLGCQSVGGKGYALNISGAASDITNPYGGTGSSSRYSPTYVLEDTVNWLKGQHSMSMGASYSYFSTLNWANTIVPTIGFGLNSNDPAYNMLTTTSGNFPGGINNTWSGYARDLYGVLTGRVTSISGTAYLDASGKYILDGDRYSHSSVTELGLFLSDSWRAKPNLTLTGGVRWELQWPFTTDRQTFSRLQDYRMIYGQTGEGNLFKPGTMSGTAPLLENFPQGARGWNMDWNNIAPSMGVTWRPNIGRGFLSKILSSDPVFRGGYGLSYSRRGFPDFTTPYGGNPGQNRSASRSATTGCDGACSIGFDGWPVLLREPERLFQGTFPASVSYPFGPGTNETIYAVVPDTRVPYTHQYSFGWQRELGRTMAVEVRYVGNKNVADWTTWNLNGTANWNFLENGFYDEFRKAQQNLRANIEAGKGNTFAYTGAPGTAPLPIFMAYLHGVPLNDPRNLDPATYTSSLFRSDSWYNQLSMYSPNMTGIAGTGTNGLQGSSGRLANAAAAGLPGNFFIPNFDVRQASANLEMNGGTTRYDSLQFELRRRMSQGLMVQGSYMLTLNRDTWTWRTLREDWLSIDSTGGPAQSIKVNWIYELPFGQGKRFGSDAGRWLDMLIGGWEWDGVFRWTTGTRFNYGGYRLVGMTEKEFQDMFRFYERTDDTGKPRIYMLPQDVIEQSTIALYKQSATSLTGYDGPSPTGRYLAPASGPDCVQYLGGRCPGTKLTRIVTGPSFRKWDFSFVKRIAVKGNMRIEARMDLYNALNDINFTATTRMGSNPLTGWDVTAAARDLNASQDAGGRITSFGLRFSW